MCKLVSIKTNYNTEVQVADMKSNTIQNIIFLANKCKNIDAIYLFGSALEDRCKKNSDIDLAIISNVSRSKLFQSREYISFKYDLYNIDDEQDYDILQFNSLDKLKQSKDFVCRDILKKGRLIYLRKECLICV